MFHYLLDGKKAATVDTTGDVMIGRYYYPSSIYTVIVSISIAIIDLVELYIS